MSTLRMAPLLLLAIMAVWIQGQKMKLQASTRQIATLHQSLEQKEAALRQGAAELKALREQAERNRKLSAELQRQTDVAHGRLHRLQAQLERDKHDDHDVQTWANTPLPFAVIRLHEHPPLGGSAAWRRLPAADPVPDGRNPPPNQ